MKYDYTCPECGKTEEKEMKLEELHKKEFFCAGTKKKQHKKRKMVISFNYVIPKSSSWSDWNN